MKCVLNLIVTMPFGLDANTKAEAATMAPIIIQFADMAWRCAMKMSNNCCENHIEYISGNPFLPETDKRA